MKYRLPRARRGMTLILTMLVLVLAVTVLSRQMLRTTVDRLNSSAGPFAVESQWIADGVARQWLEESQNLDVDALLQPARWAFRASDSSPPMEVDIRPSSAQNKLYLPALDVAAWTSFWQSQNASVELTQAPDQRLFETGNAALEVILAPRYISAQAAYLPAREGQIAPADVLTVWGDGRVDLNRCPLDILRVRLKTLTDAQLSGIVRLRSQGLITRLESLSEELSLSDDQMEVLTSAATLEPTSIELIIQIKKGGLYALYHAAVMLGKNGQVLEVRPIL